MLKWVYVFWLSFAGHGRRGGIFAFINPQNSLSHGQARVLESPCRLFRRLSCSGA